MLRYFYYSIKCATWNKAVFAKQVIYSTRVEYINQNYINTRELDKFILNVFCWKFEKMVSKKPDKDYLLEQLSDKPNNS